MNNPAVVEPVAIPSLQDAQSQRLAARMVELARTLAATAGIDDFAATGWLPDAFLLPPDNVATILVEINARLAFPYSEFLAQALVVFEPPIPSMGRTPGDCLSWNYSKYIGESCGHPFGNNPRSLRRVCAR